MPSIHLASLPILPFISIIIVIISIECGLGAENCKIKDRKYYTLKPFKCQNARVKN